MPTTEELFDAYQKATADLDGKQQNYDRAQGRFNQAKLELDAANTDLDASSKSLKDIETAFSASLSAHAATL
jgi:hypothetical protein